MAMETNCFHYTPGRYRPQPRASQEFSSECVCKWENVDVRLVELTESCSSNYLNTSTSVAGRHLATKTGLRLLHESVETGVLLRRLEPDRPNGDSWGHRLGHRHSAGQKLEIAKGK